MFTNLSRFSLDEPLTKLLLLLMFYFLFFLSFGITLGPVRLPILSMSSCLLQMDAHILILILLKVSPCFFHEVLFCFYHFPAQDE